MTTTSYTVSPSSAASQSHPENSPLAKRKPTTTRHRFKPQLSCTLCRARKLKCDRNLPCENCVKRELSTSCTFVHKGVRSVGSVQKSGSISKDVQDRINHLEKLILSLVNNGSVKSSVLPTASQELDLRIPDTVSGEVRAQVTDRSDVKETVKSLGHISLEDNHPSYVGSAHWASVLDSIADLKESLVTSEKLEAFDETSTRPGPNLLVGGVRKATKAEILASLPSKPIMDPVKELVRIRIY